MSIRFTTLSGAKYDLFEVDGQTFITRDAEAQILGLPDAEIVAQPVVYHDLPQVGARFYYSTRDHGPISTSLVVEVQA